MLNELNSRVKTLTAKNAHTRQYVILLTLDLDYLIAITSTVTDFSDSEPSRNCGTEMEGFDYRNR